MGLEQALTHGLLGMAGGGAKVIQEQEKFNRENAAKQSAEQERSERDMAIEERKLRLAGQIRRDQLHDDLARIRTEAQARESAKSGTPDNELRAAQAEDLRNKIAKDKEIEQLRKDLAKAENLARNDPSLQSLVDARRQKLDTLLGAKPTESYSISMEENPDTGERKNVTRLTGTGAPPGATKTASMPQGLPPGTKQIGTSGGKPVYQTPDGRKLIGD